MKNKFIIKSCTTYIILEDRFGKEKARALIDTKFIDKISHRKWYLQTRGYVASSRPFPLKLHRFIMGTPKGIGTDHKNGNKLDNRISNLRICSQEFNNKNVSLRKDNTSGYKGVSWSKQYNKWRVQINIKNKRVIVGYYNNKLYAAYVYNQVCLIHYGSFAKLNKIKAKIKADQMS